MPSIQPFRALLPAHHLQSDIVTRPLDNYSTGEARLIASENQYSFLHLIDPSLTEPSWRDLRHDLVYRKIGMTMKKFLESDVLIRQEIPALYIYECTHDDLVQRGIWCLCASSDYLNGQILKHESTVERREKQLAEYLKATGLDSNPVLITYPSSSVIDDQINKYLETGPTLDLLFKDGSGHRLWAVTNLQDINEIVTVIASREVLYIADGHHRAAAMQDMGQFSAVLMSTSEIRIREFNRLIKGLNGYTPEAILDQLSRNFQIIPSVDPVQPAKRHEIGMYLNGGWYKIIPHEALYDESHAVACLDVHILQEHVLSPLLGIKVPRTDARITFMGGMANTAELQAKVDHGLFSIAFTLFPLDIAELMAVADAGLIMPPKSTWIEPKFLVGLLTHYQPNSTNL